MNSFKLKYNLKNGKKYDLEILIKNYQFIILIYFLVRNQLI